MKLLCYLMDGKQSETYVSFHDPFVFASVELKKSYKDEPFE